MSEEIQEILQPQNKNTGISEENETPFQKFQMMDKPYQNFIDKKAAMGQRNFSFIPPKKQRENAGDIFEKEKSNGTETFDNTTAEIKKEPVFAWEESLPNPYSGADWKSYDLETYGETAEVYTGGQYTGISRQTESDGLSQKKKTGRNRGILIFLTAVSAIFCAAAVLYFFLASVPKEDASHNYSMTEETDGGSDRYKEYLRDDILIELVPQSYGEDSSAETAYEKIQPSTVLIISGSGDLSDEPDDTVSQGTGVIIHSDGYIVTNSHVINNSRNTYTAVVDSKGILREAAVVGYDAETDIAVLKIDGENFHPAEFAETENIKVGQEIVALGNPQGIYFRNSFTKGIISAVDRRLDSDVSYIQIDAAINPGNSGGPLCNMDGQIIGINTSKLIKENYEGIAFAVPSDEVSMAVNDIIRYGEVRRRLTLGIYGYRITEKDSETENIPAGVLIDSIIPGGPADKSPVKSGDVITGIDGETVDSVEDIKRILYRKNDGDVVKVEYMRLDTEKGELWEQKSCEIELFYSEKE